MYLSNSIKYEDKIAEMVGIIKADSVMHDKPIGRGYTLLQNTSMHPWNARSDSNSSEETPGHEFHYSKLLNTQTNTNYAYQVNRGFGVNGKNDGIIYKNLLACYAHQRNTQQNQWIPDFLEFVKSST